MGLDTASCTLGSIGLRNRHCLDPFKIHIILVEIFQRSSMLSFGGADVTLRSDVVSGNGKNTPR